jgi:tetrahydromethanopterin S-methyltransferase subunit G
MEQITPEDFATMRQQVNEMYTALIGNKIAQDGGMVNRLKTVETRLAVVEKIGNKIGWQVGMLWLSAGVILTGLMAIIFKK